MRACVCMLRETREDDSEDDEGGLNWQAEESLVSVAVSHTTVFL